MKAKLLLLLGLATAPAWGAPPLAGDDRDLVPYVRTWEDRLRAEMQGAGPTQVYALLGANYSPHDDSRADQYILRVRDGEAEFSYYPEVCYRWRRTLGKAETRAFLKRLQSYDRLAPVRRTDPHPDLHDYVRMDRKGGRRVTMLNADKVRPYADLVQSFESLKRHGKMELRYDVQDYLPGCSVLFQDTHWSAEAVWAQGSDVRVLAGPSTRFSHRSATWSRLVDGKLAGAAVDPFPAPIVQEVPRSLWDVDKDEPSWRSQSGDSLYLGLVGGIYRLQSGKEPVCIVPGNYSRVVTDPKGHWLMATEGRDWQYSKPCGGFCYDLSQSSPRQVDIPRADRVSPIAWLPEHQQFLVMRARRGLVLPDPYHLFGEPGKVGVGPAQPEFFVYDPVAEKATRVEGTFQPWLHSALRPLQAAQGSESAWAAVSAPEARGTAVGTYGLRDFSFHEQARYPGIRFDSSQMWLDAAAGWVYAVHQGHVLRLPFPVR